MASAKNDMINSYRSLCDSASDISTWYLSRIIGGSGKTIEDVIDEIGKVTKEDVVACAKATVLDTTFFLKGTLTDGGDEE